MVDDGERKLYREIVSLRETMPSLQYEAKSIKGRLTRLNKRIERLELMSFQDQISELDERINSINTYIRDASKIFSLFVIDFHQLHIKNAINLQLKSPMREEVRKQIALEQAKAEEAIIHSHNPLEIAATFRKICEDFSEKYNLRAFTG